MKRYERPEVVALRLQSEDILTESGDNDVDLGDLIAGVEGKTGGQNTTWLL